MICPAMTGSASTFIGHTGVVSENEDDSEAERESHSDSSLVELAKHVVSHCVGTCVGRCGASVPSRRLLGKGSKSIPLRNSLKSHQAINRKDTMIQVGRRKQRDFTLPRRHHPR